MCVCGRCLSRDWFAGGDDPKALTPSLWVSLASTYSFDENKGVQLQHFQAMLIVRPKQTNKQLSSERASERGNKAQASSAMQRLPPPQGPMDCAVLCSIAHSRGRLAQEQERERLDRRCDWGGI
jgi:hypothetical protein